MCCVVLKNMIDPYFHRFDSYLRRFDPYLRRKNSQKRQEDECNFANEVAVTWLLATLRDALRLVTDRAKRRKGYITNSLTDNASESMCMKR